VEEKRRDEEEEPWKRGREKRDKDLAKMIRRGKGVQGVKGEKKGEERRQNDARKREGYPSMDV
jgi:hypothetical protein